MEPIIRDWTDKVLVLDIVNSLGEQFHFEIAPGEDASKIPSKPSHDPGKKSTDDSVIVHIILPIATSKR
jgi:hypothetical protein